MAHGHVAKEGASWMVKKYWRNCLCTSS